MGEIHKIGSEYYIEFMARGLKYQQKAGSDREAAERLLADIEGKIKRGEMGTIVRDVDIDIFIKDFLAHVASEHPPRSVQRFRLTIGRFDDFRRKKCPGHSRLSQLTPSVFERYKNFLIKEMNVSPKVANLSLVLLREFCEYARKTGYLNDNPLLHIRFVPADHRSPQYLSEKELQAFVARWADGPADPVQKLQEILHRSSHPGQHEKIKEALHQASGGRIKDVAVLKHTFAFYALQKRISLVQLAKMMAVDDIVAVMAYFPFLRIPQDDVLSSSAHSL